MRRPEDSLLQGAVNSIPQECLASSMSECEFLFYITGQRETSSTEEKTGALAPRKNFQGVKGE